MAFLFHQITSRGPWVRCRSMDASAGWELLHRGKIQVVCLLFCAHCTRFRPDCQIHIHMYLYLYVCMWVKSPHCFPKKQHLNGGCTNLTVYCIQVYCFDIYSQWIPALASVQGFRKVQKTTLDAHHSLVASHNGDLRSCGSGGKHRHPFSL